jgi:hypothetical protein
MIFNAKSVFLVVIASLHWLNNVSGVYLVPDSLPLICQQGLGHLFRDRPLFPMGCRIVQILREHRREKTNSVPTTLSAIQAASHTLLSTNNYTHLVISKMTKMAANHTKPT